MWHKNRDNDVPSTNVRVVGLFDDGAAICYRNINDQWIDLKHGCYCYTPPMMWAELPDGYNV